MMNALVSPDYRIQLLAQAADVATAPELEVAFVGQAAAARLAGRRIRAPRPGRQSGRGEVRRPGEGGRHDGAVAAWLPGRTREFKSNDDLPVARLNIGDQYLVFARVERAAAQSLTFEPIVLDKAHHRSERDPVVADKIGSGPG